MKQKTKLLIIVCTLAIVLVGAAVIYEIIGDDFTAQTQLMTTVPDNSEADESTAQNVQEPQSESLAPAQSEMQENTSESQSENEQEEIIEAIDFTVQDLDGNEVKLSDYYGKPIVLNFWASWCPPCIEEMPYFENVYNSLGQDVQFLMVNMIGSRSSETVETASGFIAQNNFTFPVLYDVDATAAYAYSVRSLPTTYFINEDAQIVAGAQGSINEEMLLSGVSMIYDIPQQEQDEAESQTP